jgi:hypothetical protein
LRQDAFGSRERDIIDLLQAVGIWPRSSDLRQVSARAVMSAETAELAKRVQSLLGKSWSSSPGFGCATVGGSACTVVHLVSPRGRSWGYGGYGYRHLQKGHDKAQQETTDNRTRKAAEVACTRFG